MKNTVSLYALALAMSLGAATPGTAATLNLLLESDDDRVGDEVFSVIYDSLADFINDDQGPSGFSDLNIAPNFSVVGYAFDGQYRMLLESDDDRASDEVFAVTFDSVDDFLDDTKASQLFSSINIAPNFSVAGFGYDGDFRLVLESDADQATNEIFAATYDTFDDFVTDTKASEGFSTLNVSPNFDLVGFAYDGQYQVVLESVLDRPDDEVYVATYTTFDDFLSDTKTSEGFSALNVSPVFSVRGAAGVFVSPDPDPVAPVPLPAGGLLLLGALGGVGFASRKRR